ncbi:hypothetical protein BVRB_020570 [Beta vulgaris subsp. vulgaris]|uniref:Uncharacterized protein n=1 Tax=Beta vulgaris subsp. vulgaris TaxID=3555 RepID=A0A0J8B3V9_BETVV|nr:hypothetical protein BVRB_020570 [Beta vulgaris subsp. vulgaris]
MKLSVIVAMFLIVALVQAKIDRLLLDKVPDDTYYRVKFHVSETAQQPMKIRATLNLFKLIFPACNLLDRDVQGDYVYATNNIIKEHGDKFLIIAQHGLKDPIIEPIAAAA